MTVAPLPIEELYKVCDLDLLPFKTTAELETLDMPLGQERASSAINFGLRVEADGYNLFCVGPEGTGKNNLVRYILTKLVKEKPTPDDWCYVNNFTEDHKPKALRLPAGSALDFAKDINKLIQDLQASIPAAFEGDEYKSRLKIIEDRFQKQKTDYLNELQKSTQGRNVSILRMPVGLVVAPTKDGEVLTPEAFDKLPAEDQKELLSDLNEAQSNLEKAVKDVPKWEKEQRELIEKLNESVTEDAVKHIFDDIKKKYRAIKPAYNFLKEMNADIIDNVQLFLNDEEQNPSQQTDEDGNPVSQQSPEPIKKTENPLLRRYKVNVLVKHEPNSGCPMVKLAHPTLPNLLGRMERLQQYGALIADFNLIKSGALHEANGGFLIIEARDLINQPNAWEALKRCLKSREIKLEAGDEDSTLSTITLDPEPIPLNVKIILIGEPELYYLLSDNDPDFQNLFKVEASFTATLDRNVENISKYAKLIATLAKKYELRSFNRTAVARLIEYSSRIAEDREKLTAHVTLITDIMREADYQAKMNNSNTIGKNHIDQAIEARIRRSDRLREKMTEQIKRGMILIDTKGKKTGQINALVVYEFGNFSFGRPSRITCQVRVGKGDIIDIEREVETGGPSHTKGVYILSSYIKSKYSKDAPLSLEATLAFEQSYGEVDGDSASSTELYAMLSAIGEIPIKQNLAVTGSVNQFGEIQAIGGVNEKIEGFFDICRMRGLTGDQGVLIPASNVTDLMLRTDVIEACKSGMFNIYPIKTVDEGIEMLTGIKAGEMDKNGKYPKDTVNYIVSESLKNYLKKRIAFNTARW